MIMNERIGELIYRPSLANFIRHFDLNFKPWCDEGEEPSSLLIFGDEILIELSELKAENYIDISVVNLREERQITGGAVLHIALAMRLVDLSTLREMGAHDRAHPDEIFLSHNADKTSILEEELLGLRLVYPFIKAKGLLALQTGAFDPRLNERMSTSGINPGSLFKYRVATGTTKDSFK